MGLYSEWNSQNFWRCKLLQTHHALKIPGSKFSWTTWSAFGKQVTSSVQQKAVPVHLLIIHCFISLQYSQNINDCIIFRYIFSVGIGNELLRVCNNFSYLIQSTKFYGVKYSLELRLCVWCYGSLKIYFVSKYYESWEIGHIKGIG